MLATGLLTLLVAAALVHAHPLIMGLAAFGAALTKETAFPFVATLALLGLLLARRRTRRPIRLQLVGAGVGLGFAAGVTAALNLVRFGSPRNTYYLDSDFRTPIPGRALEFAVGLFVSPSGGIVLFWPVATALVALALALPISRTARDAGTPRDVRPALGLVAVLAGLVLGLALWWVPFGWAAWGRV